jgi:hypothetical protein
MLPIPFYANWLNAINDATTTLLLTMQFAFTAMTPSLLRGITFIVGAICLYETSKDNPVRMMWSFAINDFAVTVLDAIILIWPMMRLMREIRAGKVNNRALLVDEE